MGGCIRFLGLSSHKEYYLLSCERWGEGGGLFAGVSPLPLTCKPKVSWEDNSKYMRPKVNPAKRNHMHALRMPHHGVVVISFSRAVRVLFSEYQIFFRGLGGYIDFEIVSMFGVIPLDGTKL